MYLAKSIDELYEEVKDFDLVMCNDAPLALALNNRLDKPRVGVFAITPRQLALQLGMDILKRPLMSDIEVVKKISKDTGYPMRFVHGEIENIKTIRRYTKEVRKYLRGYKSKEIYEEYIRYPTVEKAMDAFNGSTDPYFFNKRIAVIGSELYDNLDKQMNPSLDRMDEIDLYKDWSHSAYRIPAIRELYNDHQVAENAVSLIDEDNAADIAIVLDVNGRIADAVRSELYRKKIPFINSLSIRDLDKIRDFIEFINRSHNFNITKSSQVRELLQTYGGSVNSKYDEYLIENFTEITQHEKTLELFGIMRDISKYTYGQVCEMITGKDGAQVKLMLSQLEIMDTKVNPEDTADMIYSVNNFELKHNEQIPGYEKEGVLIVDCKNSVYIDRPVVIYLGLGPEWEKDLSELNLTDTGFKDDVIEMNVNKFQVLLQQGTSRIYICNSMKDGKTTKPCVYFEKADGYDVIYDRFSDITECISGPWYNFEGKGPVKVGMEDLAPQVKDLQFSNTSYSEFVTCPRKYMFSRVTNNPEKGYTEIGHYLHNYAEFRTCFPEKAKELGQEYFVKDIAERCTPLFTPDIRSLKESKIRNAVRELDDLIESYGFSEDVHIIDKERTHGNIYFGLVGLGNGVGSDRNEVKFVSSERHMNGTLDIVKGKDIFDFKTGRAKDVDSIRNPMMKDKKNKYGNDFQCLFYLSLLQDKGIEDPEFTFISTSANEEKAALGMSSNPESAFVHVKLIDDKSKCILPNLNDELSAKKYEPIRLCWNVFCDTLVDIGIVNAVSDLDSAVGLLVQRMDIKDNKTNRGVLTDALSKIKKMVDKEFYSHGNTIYVTKDELGSFREDVLAAYDSVVRMYDTEFPIDPKIKCKDCDFWDMCTRCVDGGDVDE